VHWKGKSKKHFAQSHPEQTVTPISKAIHPADLKALFPGKQCFGMMKRPFGLHRARFFGVAKTNAQIVMAAISQNLFKAAKKITINQ
jgi:IS5 family transposase